MGKIMMKCWQCLFSTLKYYPKSVLPLVQYDAGGKQGSIQGLPSMVNVNIVM